MTKQLLTAQVLYDGIMHLKVGPEKIDFGIHKNLLCSTSRWLKKILTAGSPEASEGVIHLPDDVLSILECFNDWLYSDSLNDPKTNKPLSTWRLLLDLYLWAGYRGVPSLQNITIDTIQADIEPSEVSQSRWSAGCIIELLGGANCVPSWWLAILGCLGRPSRKPLRIARIVETDLL